MKMKPYFMLSFLLSFMLAATTLIAQTEETTNETTDTPAPVVTKKAEVKKKKTSTFTLGEIIVRDRAIANIEDATSTIEITPEDIEAHGSKDLGDALRHVPGIKVEAGSDGSTGFTMRGWRDSKVNIMVDGLPVQDGFKESLDASRIPVQNISKIIVSKGSSSALYGTSGSIGTINIITKKPVKEFARVNVELGVLENNSYSVALGAPMGKFYYWLNASARTSEGYDVSQKLDKKTRALWAEKLINPSGQANLADFDTISIESLDDYINKEEWHKTNYKKYQIAGKIGYQITKNIELGLSADYYTGEQYGYSPQIDALASYNNSANTWTNRPADDFDDSVGSSKTDVFSGGYSGFPRDYNFKIAPYFLIDLGKTSIKGNMYFRKQANIYELYLDSDRTETKWDATPWIDYSTGFNIYPSIKLSSWNKLNAAICFRYDDHAEENTEGLNEVEMVGQEVTLAIEDEMSFLNKMIRANIGVSYDAKNISRYQERATDTGPLEDQYLAKDDSWIWGTADSFNPVVGIVVEPLKDLLIIRSSESIKTQFPSLQAYSNQVSGYDLKPETSYNSNSGIELLFLNRAVSLRADYFFNYFDNKIDSYYDSTDGKITFNLGKVITNGLELTVTSSFKNVLDYLDIDFGFSYAFIHMRIKDDTPDSDLNKGDEYEDTPQHQFMVDLRCRLKTGLAINMSLTHERNAIMYAMDTAPSEVAGTAYSTDYFKKVDLHNPLKIDIKISQVIAEKYTFYVMCKNITDDYDTNPLDPGPGRMWYFGGSIEL